MNKFVNYTLIAAALFCVAAITMIGALAAMYYMTPPPVEYVTVEVPAPAVIETVIVYVDRVVEVPVTATPAPEQIAAEPYPAPAQPTEIPPTPTEPPVDYALLVSVDMPTEVITGRQYQARAVVQNAGNVSWLNYGVVCPVGLVMIPDLEPGAQFEAVFDFTAGGSSYGQYEAFEFQVLSSRAEIVPWSPVGGLGLPDPVVGVRTIGYRPTEIPPEKWEQWLNNNLPQFGKWKCEGGT